MAINVKGVNFANLTDEQKAQMAAILGVSVDDIVAPATKKTEVNNLKMKEGSETIAIDAYSNEEFDISLLTEEELTNAKKTGLSPVSFAKYQEGEKIKALMKNVSGKARAPRTGASAGEQVRAIVTAHADLIDESAMMMFMSKDESKKSMSLAYPLFIEIPSGASEAERKEMRKVKGANRFASQVWTFKNLPEREFFMTNDIYSKNIAKVEAVFSNLATTKTAINNETVDNGEQAEASKKSKKAKKNNQ